jgi:hypothetical protein
MFSSLYSVLSDLAAEYPKTFGAITSAISVGGILAAGLAYWRRPVINARFGKNEGSHGLVMVDYRNGQGSIVRQEPVKYFRLRIKNVGLTTLKECGAQLIKVTRRVVGEGPDVFDTDTYQFGWANYSQSDTRNIPSFGSFHIDLATLRMMPNGRSEFFFGGMFRPMPNTLAYCFKSHPGKARYTFDLLITADNARSRKIPIEVVFDPAQTDLKYIQLNTQYPWWRLLWRLRAHWSRRKQTP